MAQRELIFGLRAVIEALRSGKELEKILFKTGLQGELYNELLHLAKKQRVTCQRVTAERLSFLTDKNHQGVVAFTAPVNYHHLETVVAEALSAGENPIVLVLDGVTDVRNFGAIARTAECAGVKAIVIPEKGNAPVNADAIKTSAGALFRIPVCKSTGLWYTMKFLKENNFKIVAASERNGLNFNEADYSGPLAIVLGSEDKGISPQVMKMVDQVVSIPIKGEIGSLNVSVAAGIVIYAAFTSRGLN